MIIVFVRSATSGHALQLRLENNCARNNDLKKKII